MKIILTILLIRGFAITSSAQQAKPAITVEPEFGPNDTIIVWATRMPDGTLIPTGVLPWVEVVGKMPRHLARQKRKMTRLRNAVYVTYPYAQRASVVINYLNIHLDRLPDEQSKKDFIKSQERQLKASFGDQITDLSVYQGKVLMKLINRQTGINVFDILKEYKGGTNARFWQTVAFVFGSSLKQPYSPFGEDLEMEGYVQEVELLYGFR